MLDSKFADRQMVVVIQKKDSLFSETQNINTLYVMRAVFLCAILFAKLLLHFFEYMCFYVDSTR